MLLKLALSPLLAVQALSVVRKAQLLPEPDGPRRGSIGEGTALRLLILGDSSAAGVGASHQAKALSHLLPQALANRWPDRRIDWKLIAKTGTTTAKTLGHMRERTAQPFDLVVIALGVNDVTRLVSPRRWSEQQKALHALLQSRFSAAHIIRSGLPPMDHFPLLPQPLRAVLGRDAKRLDTTLQQICQKSPTLTHAPLALPYAPEYSATDGFHPSEEAYVLWAELLAKAAPQL